MNRESIIQLIQTISNSSTIEDRGNWVMSNCPLSKWTHENGTDSNPSFGILVNDKGESKFNCFSCHKRGPLLRLVELIEKYTGDDFSDVKIQLGDDELFLAPLPSWENNVQLKDKELLGEPVDSEILDLYDMAYDHPYLKSRRISNEIVEKIGLRIDPDNKGVERILFPIYSLEGEFYGFSGRATNNYDVPRVRDYFGLPKQLLLLGSHYAGQRNDKFIISVEGLFDYATILQCGYWAVASLFSSHTPYQIRILKNIGLPIVSMRDNDTAGRLGTNELIEYLSNSVPIYGVTYPKRRNKQGKLYKVKDPGDLRPDEIHRMLNKENLIIF